MSQELVLPRPPGAHSTAPGPWRSRRAGRGRPLPGAQPGPSRLLWVVVVTVLVLSTGAGFAISDPDGTRSNTPVLVLWVLVYVGAGLLLLDGVLRERKRFRVPLSLALFVGLATLSVSWSVEPPTTLRRALGLLGTVIVGLAIAQRLRPVDVLDGVRRAMLVVALASLALYAAGLSLAIDDIHGTLRGVVATKNTLGRLMGIGLFAAAATALLRPDLRRRCLLSGLPMLAALALTDSKGGIGMGVLGLGAVAAVALWRGRASRLLVVGVTALTLGVGLPLLPRLSGETLAASIGEDVTLTGRTAVWSESWAATQEHLTTGHGYGAFWSEDGGAADLMRAKLFWDIPNAHNGLLEVALDLGLVGAALALLVVGALLVQGLRDARAGRTQSALLRLSMVGLVVLSNLAESAFLLQNQLQTLMLVAALAAREPNPVASPARRARPAVPSQPAPPPRVAALATHHARPAPSPVA